MTEISKGKIGAIILGAVMAIVLLGLIISILLAMKVLFIQ